MIHGFALGFAFAAGVMLFRSIIRRGFGRTVVALFKTAFVGATMLAAAMVIAILLFRLLVGDQFVPQVVSAGAPAGNWLSEEQAK